ncbi:MAG TPA: carbon monoxide dehydrogenase subunit G [Nitrososphaerales archaeon]|nr:carbon monoxide dehydrogenase subunit G [Nitrososphaerales archaeon]
MQLHLEGSNTIDAGRERVYSLLTDPNFIAKTLPDAEDVRVLDGSNLEATIKLRVAVVSAKIVMRMTVDRTQPPATATLVAEGRGSGSTMKISSVFTLSGDSTTTMAWSADTEIGGVMAGLGSTLLRGFATKKVAEIFEGITKAIEGASSEGLP